MSDKEGKDKKKEMKRADTKRSGFFKGVLDNLRSSVTQLPTGGKGPGSAGDMQDIPEDKLRKELFNIEKTARHGFPHNPSAVTYDPIQKLVAVGTHSGTIRILGRPGVEITLQHVLDCPVVQLQFIVNEGLLLSLCADDQIHEWNIKGKTPEIVHSLKFQKERVTFFHLPFQSKWLYLGTEGGNVHVVNIDTFSLSGYVINWNKAIEISRKTKPGAVVHLSENPVDSNKLLIGFEAGTIVLWDLRSRAAEVRFQYNEALSSVSWHFEGKQFMASHGDGSLTTFNIRTPGKPQSVLYPHARTKSLAQTAGGPDSAGQPGATGSPLVVPSSSRNNLLPITKVQWRTTRAGDDYVIFSGGLPFEKGNSEVSTLTVSQGRSTTVLEMESPILDFLTLNESPFAFDTQDPFAVVALLRSDLVVVDLMTHGYPCFRNPYSMDIHESTVVSCQYLADCPGDLIPCMYSVGAKAAGQSRHFSEREWPITGGEWGQAIVSYPELIVTGHADGSVRFWDASSLGFQLLYRLKTSRLFEKLKSDDDPFAVGKMSFDPEGRQLAVAGSSYVALFSFAKAEGSCSVTVLDTPIHFEMEEPAPLEVPPRGQAVSNGERVTLRPCPQKWAAGLQPSLVCQFLSSGAGGNADSARRVTCMAVSSAFNLLAFGNDSGLVVVDTVHNTCVLNFATPELYEPQPNKSPTSQPTSPNKVPPPPLPGCHPTSDPTHPTARAIEGEPASGAGPASGDTTPTDGQKATSTKDQRAPAEAETVLEEDKSADKGGGGGDKGASDRDIDKVDKATEKAEDRPTSTSSATGGRSRRPDALRRGTSIQETIADACKRTLQRMLSSPSTRSADPYQRSPRSPKRQDNGLPDPAESSPDQRAVMSVSRQTRASREPVMARTPRGSRPPGSPRHFCCLPLVWCRLQSQSGRGLDDAGRGVSTSTLQEQHRDSGMLPKDSSFKQLLKDCSFSRSRSSSISSLENVSHEAITCLTFCDTFCSKKGDCSSATPSLWVGTSLGSVLPLPLTLANESRSALASPGSGTLFKLKSPVLCIGFIDSSGAQLVSDGGRLRGVSSSASSHLAVLVSEKLARVVTLPSQNTVVKTNLTDTSFVICADVMQLKSCDVPCLVSYIANGNILVHSLPSLKPVFEGDFQTLVDLQICRTFCLSKNGHGLYMSSPTEFQKFTVSAEFCNQLQELKCTVHTTKEMPEAPKQSFFKGLFGGGPSILDREELFGEAGSGKASKTIARHIPGNAANLEAMKERTGTLAGEIARTRMALDERGQALSQLEERTGRMMNEAEVFASTTSQLMNKYKDKKWYQF